MKQDRGEATTGTRPLSSSLRTLEILDTIAEFDEPFRLSDVTRKVGGSRATVYQKIVTLMAAGWIEQLPDNRYRLSHHATRIGTAALNQAGLAKRIHPLMDRLSTELGESVSLAVLDGTAIYIVDEVLTPDLLRVSFRVGTTMAMETTATGRVLAAFMSEGQRRQMEEQAIALPDQATIARVREQFYATSERPGQAEVLAVAAPIFDGYRRCIAVLSVAGPPQRIDLEQARMALMRATSVAINEIGGWKPWGDRYG